MNRMIFTALAKLGIDNMNKTAGIADRKLENFVDTNIPRNKSFPSKLSMKKANHRENQKTLISKKDNDQTS